MVRKSIRFITVLFVVFGNFTVLIPASEAIIRIMPLGDSITRGSTGSSDQTGYRRELDLTLTGDGYIFDFVGSLADGIPGDFDQDHEGHSGFTDSQIAGLVYDYLTANPADIVLLHIGTNGLEESAADVAAILDEIDRYENDTAATIWVILARIINRSCITDQIPCPESVTTMNFNANVASMAQSRILAGDKIQIIDMENGAGIDYHLSTDNPPGDMWDDKHPFDIGYEKMADVWFSAIQQVTLPVAIADADPTNAKENTVVILDGSNSSDPNDNIVSYFWEQLSGGTPVQLSDETDVSPTFTTNDGSAGETLNFRLTVTDNEGLESSDVVSVRVIEGAAEIISTWGSGFWYRDEAASQWTQLHPAPPDGDIAAGDFTGDGIADVASIWASGLWYQDGATLVWRKVSGAGARSLTAGDVTGDGRAEIISTWASGIWYWDGATSQWTQMHPARPDGGIAAGDFTGDGKADVASIWASGLWYQNGANLIWTKVSNTVLNRVTAGDVTGDGRSEIIGTWSGGISYWDLATSQETQMYTANPGGDIVAGDFSGDGKADVASIWASGLWYQDGATLGWTKVSGTGARSLTAGDVTGQ